VAELCSDVIALVFKVLKVSFRFPTRPAALDQLNTSLRTERSVTPAVVIGGFLIHLKPVLEEVDHIGIFVPLSGHWLRPAVDVPAALGIG